MFTKLFRCKKGAALLEYALLAAGVSLIAAAGVAIFGHKTSDMISSVAAIMPGAHADDNGPIVSGKIIETTSAATGQISIDAAAISGTDGVNQPRLGNNLGLLGLDSLVLEVGEEEEE